MATAAFPVLDAGPFDRIVGFSYSALTYSFQIRRDDGLEYTPTTPEWLVMQLYSSDWAFVCSLSAYADPELGWYAPVPGLVIGCEYEEPYYTIAFNEALLTELVGQERSWLRLYLVTTGLRTLETTYPRLYVSDQGDPLPLPPGRHTVQIPFFDVIDTTTYPDPFHTIRRSTIYSSVPYSVEHIISGAVPSARFRLPILIVVWTPTYRLLSWTYDLKLTIGYSGTHWFMPHQYIDNLTPPATLPTSDSDKQVITYHDLVLTIGIGASSVWNAMRLEITTSFGYTATIPYSTSEVTGFSNTYTLPDIRAANLLGDTYERSCQLIWNVDQVPYGTTYWPLSHPSEIATLVEGPNTRFEDILFFPQPE
ncbi:hypothetical protein SIID45300_00094 [Candidatus Magnetaquicoccaceae bacterium FCR-1]|uniref:Uncharacterized protein n=1 Tax=Candidatus Magnetaquiglobus chichijimensis TaxID=3141448 RepID=A0ABQ0C4J8_9PROT